MKTAKLLQLLLLFPFCISAEEKLNERNFIECAPELTLCAGENEFCGPTYFFEGDFLYWTAREEGLAYASTSRAPENATASVSKGEVFSPNPEWSPGFKVGAGVLFPEDFWEVFANYTYSTFSTSGSAKTPSNPNDLLVSQWNLGSPATQNNPFLSFIPINTPITSAKSNWDLDFNVFDLMLRRNFFLGAKFYLQAQFGLKGTWQKQKYKLDFRNILFPPGVDVDQRIIARFESDIWGVGTRGGVEGAFVLTKSLHLYGNFALTPLLVHFDSQREDRIIVSTNPAIFDYDLILTKLRDEFYAIKGVFENELGLRYEYQRENKPTRFMVQLGFTSQLWSSVSAFYRRLDEVAHGDLSLYGLTVKGRIDF